LTSGATWASPLPPDQIQWTYNFSPGAPAVLADGNPSAGVTFTNEPTKSAIGNSDIVASNLRVFSSATADAPDVLAGNGAYSLALTLTTTDASGTHTGTLTFTGRLAGSLSAESANVSNQFGPNTTQTLTLGSVKFDVQLRTYTPPGPPTAINAGSISAHVTVSDATVPQMPEPSSMLLAGLGLTILGGRAWRKRVARSPAPS
jgi:hypothetical protein